MSKIHYTRFPVTSPLDAKIANLLATSRCNGIWETTRHKRHNGRLLVPTCYRLVADLSFMLRNCYREVANKYQSPCLGLIQFSIFVLIMHCCCCYCCYSTISDWHLFGYPAASV